MAGNATVLIRRLCRPAARSDGFGLVEMLIALTLLTIAIGGLITAFAASAVSLRRSGQKGTALALADAQMETYRKVPFTGIRIDGARIPPSGTYVTANSVDSTIPPSTNQAVAGQNGDDICPASGEPAECLPVQSVSGPDQHQYRIETYVDYVDNDQNLTIRPPTPGLTLKRVTVVVRDGATGTILAREASAFERSST